ncbi:hypothetical protein H2198_006092 [Neophaeococcomyces mojaviensis]|uniref:Uncharacterized protein n=1 Tax=Neophaeococcomyces mojaviensis TaxID=3383035 RepID=A0ACC3A3W8_9EURO|nr:hypothetical protein H2198_006092 [Knufia sp. JES_112]
MTSDTQVPLHWLELQEPERYRWDKLSDHSSSKEKGIYYRRLGVVESLFDNDGSVTCGRADLHQNLRMEVCTILSDDQLRERIILAWTLMRHSHVLLSCQSMHIQSLFPEYRSAKWTDQCFVYRWPQSVTDAVKETQAQLQFVADEYPDVNPQEFFHHIMNTARAIDPHQALSKLYIMPFRRTDQGTVLLHFMPILAHQITDGLTTYRWNNHFSQILNFTKTQLHAALNALFTNENDVLHRLPPAQEALYPLRSHTLARERWHWLLTRVLRHVRNPPPAAFQNPLRRPQPLLSAKSFVPTFNKVLDYSITPPLNAGHVSADLYGRSVANMRFLCRSVGISIGSGCFTLVALVMMYLYERLDPHIALTARRPFVGSFPVNPRPFLSGEPTTGKEDSCMLAFSDGVTLPFLPCDLDFAGRFRLLGRLAHKQLRQYQKRKRTLAEEVHLGSRSPSQLIPALFCSTLERMEGRTVGEHKAGINVQGNYPAKASPTLATCGISSVGDQTAVLAELKVDLQQPLEDGKDVLADFRGMASVVRPRDGEFLVGAIGERDHLGFLAAFDANAIDSERTKEWKKLMETMLDFELESNGRSKL